MFEAKKMHEGHISGRRKNVNQKKFKIEGVAFISKKQLKSHLPYQKKRLFQFRILRSVSTCSIYLLQALVQFEQISVHPNREGKVFGSCSLNSAPPLNKICICPCQHVSPFFCTSVERIVLRIRSTQKPQYSKTAV